VATAPASSSRGTLGAHSARHRLREKLGFISQQQVMRCLCRAGSAGGRY
jgi:hypothetical protein